MGADRGGVGCTGEGALVLRAHVLGEVHDLADEIVDLVLARRNARRVGQVDLILREDDDDGQDLRGDGGRSVRARDIGGMGRWGGAVRHIPWSCRRAP